MRAVSKIVREGLVAGETSLVSEMLALGFHTHPSPATKHVHVLSMLCSVLRLGIMKGRWGWILSTCFL